VGHPGRPKATALQDRLRQCILARVPHAFLNKRNEPILVAPLDERHEDGLARMYLAYEPRNSFWGLPPIQDDACRQWVEGMIADGVNLLALSFDAGVVGHAGLFPMDEGACEMLVVVSPRFQNQGIGTQLARCAVQVSHEIGFCRIWLSIEANNLRARHVFRKCGFEYLAQQDPTGVEMAMEVCGYHGPSDLPVSEIMTREVLTVYQEMPCRAAIKIFLSQPVGALPVVDGHDKVIGIVSQTDLILPANANKRVRDIMTRRVVTVEQRCPVTKVIGLFNARRIRCIPVLDEREKLVGVVGRKDILAYYHEHL